VRAVPVPVVGAATVGGRAVVGSRERPGARPDHKAHAQINLRLANQNYQFNFTSSNLLQYIQNLPFHVLAASLALRLIL
jgi:hypothetical protein